MSSTSNLAEYPTVSDDPVIQAFYQNCREKGQSHNIAEICAFRQPTGTTGTDKAFMEGRVLNHGLEGWCRDRYIQRAKQAGIDIAGKVYMSQLADKRGPECPHAWISGRDDMIAVAKKQGRSVSGTRLKDVEPPPAQQVRLAEDLIQDMAKIEIAKNPDKARKPRELREEVIEKYGSKPQDTPHMKAAK